MDKSFNQRSILRDGKIGAGSPQSKGVDVEFGKLGKAGDKAEELEQAK